jgi:hypothetical protein
LSLWFRLLFVPTMSPAVRMAFGARSVNGRKRQFVSPLF